MPFNSLPDAGEWKKACDAVKLEYENELWTALAVLSRVPAAQPEQRLAMLPKILKLASDFKKSKEVVAAGPKAVKLVQDLIDVIPKARKKYEEESLAIKQTGAKEIDVVFIIEGWNKKPIVGGASARFESPGVPPIHKNGGANANGFGIDNVRLRPEGTVHLSVGAPAIEATTDYEFKPGKAILKFRAEQQSKKYKISAKKLEEATTKTGVKGTLGLDFKVLTIGGEVARESEVKRGRETAVEWELEAGLPTFKEFKQI